MGWARVVSVDLLGIDERQEAEINLSELLMFLMRDFAVLGNGLAMRGRGTDLGLCTPGAARRQRPKAGVCGGIPGGEHGGENPQNPQIHPNSFPPPNAAGRGSRGRAGGRGPAVRARARSAGRPRARARGAVTSDAVGAGLAARHLGPCVEAAEARRRERPAAFAGAR